jgi:hypothetical protein
MMWGQKAGCPWMILFALPLQYQRQSMSLTEFNLIIEHPCNVETFHGAHVQEVLMWQTFARLASRIDDLGKE